MEMYTIKLVSPLPVDNAEGSTWKWYTILQNFIKNDRMKQAIWNYSTMTTFREVLKEAFL